MQEIKKAKLSAADYVESGYGQVEPNHLSAQRTAQIYAQLPLGVDKLEQGQFAKYDYANKEINMSGAGEWMLCYSEVKTYDVRETDADFVNVKGGVYPRLFKTNVGDMFTTNTIMGTEPEVGGTLAPNENGILAEAGDATECVWEIVKIYTLADGQRAVKVMRIK